jgi:hypothetical protein
MSRVSCKTGASHIVIGLALVGDLFGFHCKGW